MVEVKVTAEPVFELAGCVLVGSLDIDPQQPGLIRGRLVDAAQWPVGMKSAVTVTKGELDDGLGWHFVACGLARSRRLTAHGWSLALAGFRSTGLPVICGIL